MVCGHRPCHPRRSWLLRGAGRQAAFSAASWRLWTGQRVCLLLPRESPPHSCPPAPVLAALVPSLVSEMFAVPLQGLGTDHAPPVLSPHVTSLSPPPTAPPC